MRRKVEQDASTILEYAHTTTYYTGSDGVALGSIAHPREDGGANQSNYAGTTTNLTEANIEAALVAAAGWLDGKGQKILVNFDLMVVPPAKDLEARVLLQSTGRTGTTFLNEINPYQGRFDILVYHWLTDADDWFLIDRQWDFLKFIWRRQPTLEQDDKTSNDYKIVHICGNIYYECSLTTGKSEKDNPSQPHLEGVQRVNENQPIGLKRDSDLRSNSKNINKLMYLDMLTKQEKNSIIHAVCIGDGYLRYPGPWGKTARTPGYISKNCQLTIQHDIKQVDFLEWKRDLLEECIGKKIKIRIHDRIDKNNKKRTMCRFTVSDAKFNKVYNRLYKDKNKILTKKLLNRLDERAMAIWFGDDGYGGIITGKRYGKIYPNQKYKRLNIATDCFDEESIENLINYLIKKWNIFVHCYHGAIYIQKKNDVEKFIEIVEKYLYPIKSIRKKLCKV